MTEREDKMWMLKIDQAKAETNLERARLGEPSSEKLPDIEFSGVYKDSTIARKIQARLDNRQQPLALFTDIDNTFYRTDQIKTMHNLDKLAESENMGKVFITGRDQPMVESQTDLPKADIVAGAVGTEISVLNNNGKYERDEKFRQLLLNTWDRDKVYEQSQKLVEENPKLIFQPRDDPQTREKDETNQPPQEFKISFHVFGEYSDLKEAVKLLEENVTGARAIGSTDIHDPHKFNIDLLPLAAGKEMVIRYLSVKLGLKGFTAGDSGNDLSMLLEGGQPAIVVGGARQEAKIVALQTGEPSPRVDVREFTQGERVQKIYVGKDKYEEAAQAIINALGRGDFNPDHAVQFMIDLYQLNKRQ